ncbi:MAG: glycosyltransferase family 2 protein [Candidatus Thorarchaeota archaeon]
MPAYNEELTISKVIKNVPLFSDLDEEIIVTDDGNQDFTADMAKKAGAIIIPNKINLGLGKSFRVGLEYWLKNKADIIVILDADGQYNSKEIKRLICPILSNKADLMMGNRFISSNTTYQGNSIRKIGNIVLSIFVSKMLLKLNNIYDVQCSFRAFNRKLGEILKRQLLAKYNYAQEMFIISCSSGFTVKQTPIDCYNRISAKSKLIEVSVIHVLRIISISLRTLLKMKILSIRR